MKSQNKIQQKNMCIKTVENYMAKKYHSGKEKKRNEMK